MKFKIVKKYIDKFFINIKDWDEQFYIKICNELGYIIKPIIYNDKISGYSIYKEGEKIPVYRIWYYDEFNSRMQGWRQYEWSEYHDREFDDSVLTISQAKLNCNSCKNKIEKYYGEEVEIFEL